MSIPRVLGVGGFIATAAPAIASPIFLPSAYNATISSGSAFAGLTVIMSSSDINTAMSAGGPVYADVFRAATPNDRVTANVGFTPASVITAAGRGTHLAMTFTPSSDATFTFGCTSGNDTLTSCIAQLFENGNVLLTHYPYIGATASIQVYAGHVYQVELSASVYSHDGAMAYAELSDPVPAPAGLAVIGVSGLFAASRRRRTC